MNKEIQTLVTEYISITQQLDANIEKAKTASSKEEMDAILATLKDLSAQQLDNVSRQQGAK